MNTEAMNANMQASLEASDEIESGQPRKDIDTMPQFTEIELRNSAGVQTSENVKGK